MAPDGAPKAGRLRAIVPTMASAAAETPRHRADFATSDYATVALAPTIGPMPLRPPHADLAPYRTHAIAVDGGHCLHVDEFGREDGVPALVLHGGPGSGISPLQRRLFDPERYRIICPDQRGSGRSTPPGETAHNTTSNLLDDLATLRSALGVSRWLVVGGSWGATLAILHAAAQPDAVSGLLLRSVFLARPADITAFFDGIDLTELA